MEPLLQAKQFEELCTSFFGPRGWQAPVARIMGVSQAHVSNIKNDKAEIKKSELEKLMRFIESKGNKNLAADLIKKIEVVVAPEKEETDDEIRARLLERHDHFKALMRSVGSRTIPSLIISGPAGIGKTHTVREVFKEREIEAEYLSGVASATGLYTALYNNKDGGIVVLDDCDSIFADEDSLNILKAALDSTEKRTICWLKQSSWLEKEGVEKKFDFNGSIIFLTNYDMEEMINRGTKLSPQFEALVSRCLYLSLGMHTRREILLRMEQIAPSILDKLGLHQRAQAEIMTFVRENLSKWRQFSLREVIKLAQVYKTGAGWQNMARISMMRR